MGKAVAADPDSSVTFSYKYDDDTSKYDQDISVDGKVVSSLSTDSGKAQGWGTAVECQSAACGKVPAHKYVDTKLVLDKADPNYGDTKGTTGATGDLATAHGGKTWTIDTISIEAHTYTSAGLVELTPRGEYTSDRWWNSIQSVYIWGMKPSHW